MPGLIREPLAGCIKWLPRKDELVPADASIDEGCCQHPVVILSTKAQNGRVEILIITSFGGIDLETKYPTHLSARKNHLPIKPHKAHPDNGILLVLENPSIELRKKSYVKTRDRRTILLASLQPYNRQGPEVFLSKKSYKILVQYVGFVEHEVVREVVHEVHEAEREETPPLPPSWAISAGRMEADHARARDYYARTAEYTRTQASRLSSETPRRPAWLDSGVAVPRAERQPLLYAREERWAHVHRNTPTLPTTHPIRVSYGGSSSASSGWGDLWTCLKVVLWLCLGVLACYGIYRGGSWIITAAGPALEWAKEAFGSAGEGIKSTWALLMQKLGFGNQEAHTSSILMTPSFKTLEKLVPNPSWLE